jgi:hypothetical protein
MKTIVTRKWFYPLVYFLLIVISMAPPITEIPYDSRQTPAVIGQILSVSLIPYQNWGWIFHVATLALIAFIAIRPQKSGRIVAAYFGLNYLLIAAIQTNAQTAAYGFAVQTGALIVTILLGIIWLIVAWRNELTASFRNVPRWRWLLLPFALLVFWSPIALEGSAVVFHFNPLLLLTFVDYGLAYCFVTPVFLFLLILFHPHVNEFAFRVTAFNGLIYGVYNLTHWFNPDSVIMGIMHLPLLILPLIALFMSHGRRKESSLINPAPIPG